MAVAAAKRKLRNFKSYARMEAANVVLVPAFALWLAWPREPFEYAAMALAIAACSGFLIVGTLYWFAVDRRLRTPGASPRRALAFADRAERPLLIATAAATAATVALIASRGFTPSAIAAACLTVLAALEYVNYYRVQLQHFDNRADLRRLVSGRGLKRAHMARDLAAYRAARDDLTRR